MEETHERFNPQMWQSLEHLENDSDEKMLAVFPLGAYRDRKPTPVSDAVPQTTVRALLGLEEPTQAPEGSVSSEKYHPDRRQDIAGFGGSS